MVNFPAFASTFHVLFPRIVPLHAKVLSDPLQGGGGAFTPPGSR